MEVEEVVEYIEVSDTDSEGEYVVVEYVEEYVSAEDIRKDAAARMEVLRNEAAAKEAAAKEAAAKEAAAKEATAKEAAAREKSAGSDDSVGSPGSGTPESRRRHGRRKAPKEKASRGKVSKTNLRSKSNPDAVAAVASDRARTPPQGEGPPPMPPPATPPPSRGAPEVQPPPVAPLPAVEKEDAPNGHPDSATDGEDGGRDGGCGEDGEANTLLARVVGREYVGDKFGTSPDTWTYIPSVDGAGEESTFELHESDSLDVAQRYSKLVQLVAADPEFKLAEAICEVAPTNKSEVVIRPLVSVFISTLSLQHYMALRIQRVVAETVDKATLFRSKTFTTVLLSVFAQSIGHSYLKQVVRPLISNICSSPHSFEVDPDKLKEDEDIMANTKALIACLEECFQYINKTIDRCPRSLWIGCKLLYELVRQKFEATSLSSVGGLFFLRFLCPALVNPAGVGLTIDGIGPRERRHLVLISKTLQSLSNGVEFGGKESYMMGLNKFIRDYKPKIQVLLQKLADGPTVDASVGGEAQGIVERDCYELHRWLIEHKSGLDEHFAADPSRGETKVQLESILEALGDPTDRDTGKPTAWKTSDLPPELAAALLAVEMGTDPAGEEEPMRNKVLYEIGTSPDLKKKRRNSVKSLFRKRANTAERKRSGGKD